MSPVVGPRNLVTTWVDWRCDLLPDRHRSKSLGVYVLRPARLDRFAFELGKSVRSGPCSSSSASRTESQSLPRTKASRLMVSTALNSSSSGTPRRRRDSAREPPEMASKTCSNGQ